MEYACGRYVIAYNGEIYNHLGLRKLLRSAREDGEWRGHSDTETLLACFQAWGIDKTLARVVGMFAIALWDRETRTLTLARDRMGEKPLYYGWQGDTFLFGSELKAFKAQPAFQADIDRGALVLLLRHNYVPAPYSIYEGIFKLPAGTYVQVTTWNSLVSWRWFQSRIASRATRALKSGLRRLRGLGMVEGSCRLTLCPQPLNLATCPGFGVHFSSRLCMERSRCFTAWCSISGRISGSSTSVSDSGLRLFCRWR